MPTVIKIEEVEKWHELVPLDIQEALWTQKYDTIKSDVHQTLRLEGMARFTIHGLNSGISMGDSSIAIRNIIRDMSSDLEIIHEKCNIIGHMLLPSKIPMAITDLSIPIGVFCYPVVDVYYLGVLGSLQLKTYKGFLT